MDTVPWTNGIHVSLWIQPDQGHDLLSPGFFMNKFVAKQQAFIIWISHLTWNEVHFMAEVKRNTNNANKIEY